FFVGGERGGQFGAVHANVDVPAASHLKLLKAGNRADSSDNLLGNLARRLAKFASEFKSKRQCVLAEFDFRRRLDPDVRIFQAVSTTEKLPQMLDESAFQISIQDVL